MLFFFYYIVLLFYFFALNFIYFNILLVFKYKLIWENNFII